MAWYETRTDSELVELARGGDARARSVLFDRTIRPASAVALHLTGGDRETAIPVLTTAYRMAFRRLHRLEDGEQFTPWLLRMVDSRAPFPVGLPADSEILTAAERDRVRRAVGVQTEAARKVGRPAALAAALLAVIALLVVGAGNLPSVQISDGPAAEPEPTASSNDGADVPIDDVSTSEAASAPAITTDDTATDADGAADATADDSEAAASDEPSTAVAGDEAGQTDDGLAETR